MDMKNEIKLQEFEDDLLWIETFLEEVKNNHEEVQSYAYLEGVREKTQQAIAELLAGNDQHRVIEIATMRASGISGDKWRHTYAALFHSLYEGGLRCPISMNSQMEGRKFQKRK